MDDKTRRYYDALVDMIDIYTDDMVDDLGHLLGFCTVSGSNNAEEQRLFRNEVSRAFSFISRLSRKFEFPYRSYDNRVCIMEEIGTGHEVLGLPLHIDVVPSGEGWHYPAFGAMVEDGVIYGRGAQDNKGPIIQLSYALWMLKKLGLNMRRTVRMVIASQEETGRWDDVKSYLQRETAPDFSIVCDADFPIINGEKGMVDIRLNFSWDEPDMDRKMLKFSGFEAGERPNIVPNRADLTWEVNRGQSRPVFETLNASLEEYLADAPEADTFPLRLDTDVEDEVRQMHATFLGTSSHSSRPEKGHNAAVDALAFLARVPELPEPIRATAEFLSERCRDHYGSGLGLEAEHDFLGRTTINLAIVSIDRNSAEAVINIRPTYGQSTMDVLRLIRTTAEEWASNSGVKTRVAFRGQGYEPLYVDPDEHGELIGSLQSAYSEVTGYEPKLCALGGTTFAKAFPNAVSFGPVLPDEEKSLAHEADECVRIEHMVRNTKIYGLALLLLAADLENAPDEPRVMDSEPALNLPDVEFDSLMDEDES